MANARTRFYVGPACGKIRVHNEYTMNVTLRIAIGGVHCANNILTGAGNMIVVQIRP